MLSVVRAAFAVDRLVGVYVCVCDSGFQLCDQRNLTKKKAVGVEENTLDHKDFGFGSAAGTVIFLQASDYFINRMRGRPKRLLKSLP